VTALTEELKQKRSLKSTFRAADPSEPSNQNSAVPQTDPISKEVIKSLVAPIIEPALKNLTVSSPQQKGRQGRVKTSHHCCHRPCPREKQQQQSN